MSSTFWIGPVICMAERALAYGASVADWWHCTDSAANYLDMLDCYMAHHLESIDIVFEYFDCAAGWIA